MSRLIELSLRAAMIGFCGFVADSAIAQTTAACPAKEAVVYFAPDSAALNSEQNHALVNMAEAARACGAKNVQIYASGNAERAQVVAAALSQRGVKATIVTQPALLPGGDTMLARSITLRVAGDVSSSS
jgi:carbon starvation protein CstA